jgi:ATP-binding cassette, subfamily F, member 3
MSLVSGDKLSQKFRDQVVLDSISFTVNNDDRIGLVGRNGTGKTTLLEILAGLAEPDSGVVTQSRGCVINIFEQDKTDILDLDLFTYVESVRADLLTIRSRMSELEELLERTPHDSTALTQLGNLHSQFENLGGFTFESEIHAILEGLGFEKERLRDRLRTFSGGEKNRASLARLLAGRGTLLLLDEPTNHLDIESTSWLEEYLRNTHKAYIVVSHDRAFLTRVVDTVWELNRGKLDTYRGGFERYVAERALRRDQHEHLYALQQQQIVRIEDFIRRNMAGQKTKQAQSRLKFLGRIKRLPPPKTDKTMSKMNLTSSGRSFQHVLSVHSATLGYAKSEILSDVSFDLYRGDKVGVVGRNGSGKTTLIRALLGEISPMKGELELGDKVSVAYFDQEQSDLNSEGTVLENLWELDPLVHAEKMRAFLGRFGFSDEDHFKLVSSLSGGEKTKLALARLIYKPANFIILDEPTNHLDIQSREALEEGLQQFDGSCLIVSHDRYFLDRVATKIFHVSDGCIHQHLGNYTDFKERTAPKPAPAAPKLGNTRATYTASKEKLRSSDKKKKTLASVRARIADIEKEIAALDSAIREDIPRSDWSALSKAAQKRQEAEDALLDQYAKLESLEKEMND